MKNQKRKTRSDKFPLTLHSTGQYCKKINGRIYYFGANKKQALKRYLDQATYLHGYSCATAKGSDGSMALKELCDLYLQYQHARVRAGAITGRHYSDQVKSLNKLMWFLGKGRRIRTISTLDFQNYKRQLQNAHSTAQRPNSHIGTTKAMFHWARRNDILERIPNIDAISKGKIVRQQTHLRFQTNCQAAVSTKRADGRHDVVGPELWVRVYGLCSVEVDAGENAGRWDCEVHNR